MELTTETGTALIVPGKVTRDDQGMWTHPDLPFWDESATEAEQATWAAQNKLEFAWDYFRDSASDELNRRWFKEKETDCSEWRPAVANEQAFLLTIHDTDEGPVAVFAVPLAGHPMALEIKLTYASDDSCQMQLYTAGHVEPAIFVVACRQFLLAWDERELTPDADKVRQIHWRRDVPEEPSTVCDFIFTEVDKDEQDSFPVTLSGEWLPIHAE